MFLLYHTIAVSLKWKPYPHAFIAQYVLMVRFSDQRILKTHLTETLGFEDRSGGERSWGQDPCLWLTLGDHTYKGASPESTNRDIQPHLLMPIKSKATFNPLNLSYRYNYMYTCSTPICFPEKKMTMNLYKSFFCISLYR